MRVAPASTRRVTAEAVRVGTGWVAAHVGLPALVGNPATSYRSFATNVVPASGPSAAPETSIPGPIISAPSRSSVGTSITNGVSHAAPFPTVCSLKPVRTRSSEQTVVGDRQESADGRADSDDDRRRPRGP